MGVSIYRGMGIADTPPRVGPPELVLVVVRLIGFDLVMLVLVEGAAKRLSCLLILIAGL